ncbi:MAG: SusC/RagA family TonB-linked outer membrane protein [Bacteroidales bacterium]|nr:SusC/RagA family TonB-linked outer membrane protein [Bacteroidales bacterium]
MQQQRVTGIVTDATNGEAVIGANVIIEGTTIGTVTDIDGKFSLEIQKSDAVLVVSFLGYVPERIQYTGQSAIDVKLVPDITKLEEVVVVGYGSMKKKDLTGAAIKADIESFRESPNTSIMQSLQGSVAGITIGQTNRAGQDPSIEVRGQTTINGSKDPLIILDGIIYRGRISDINPADIESVDILKDASSKAVYGAQAANGVIMITSKGGKKSQKPVISYSASYSISEPTVKHRLLNRNEFLEKVKAIEYKRAYTAESGYTEPNPTWDYTQSEMLPAVVAGANNGTEYDWWGAATSRGHLNNHVVNVTGGGEKISYFLSGGFTDQKALIINDEYQRSHFRLNIDSDIAKWLTVGTNTFVSFADFSGAVPTMANLRRVASVVTPKDADGNWVINPNGDNLVNPFLNAQALSSDKRHQINANFYGLVKIPWVEGLTYRLNYNYTLDARNNDIFNEFDAGLTGYAKKETANSYFTLLDNIVNFTRSFNSHNINATFVYGYNETNWDGTIAEGDGFSNTALGYNSVEQATNQFISSGAWEEKNLYQMGRVAYNFKNRYLLTATIRRDGFSGFAENNKFGLFPSVGAGWVVTEEGFFNIKAIDYIKVRASYGVTGNQTSRYSSLASVESGDNQKYVFGDGGQTQNGLTVKSMANGDLTWETTDELNAGVDFTILDNRIRGSIDYYNARTKDLLWDVVIPRVTGFSSVRTNLGELKNHGIEINLNTTPVKTTNFKWDLNVTFASNKNKIVSLLGEDKDGDGKEDDLISSGLFIGESIGTIYGFEIEGIWQVDDEVMSGYFPGTYKIKDQAGPDKTAPDGNITAADDRVILGESKPIFTMGIQNTLAYKNFTLRFFSILLMEVKTVIWPTIICPIYSLQVWPQVQTGLTHTMSGHLLIRALDMHRNG